MSKQGAGSADLIEQMRQSMQNDWVALHTPVEAVAESPRTRAVPVDQDAKRGAESVTWEQRRRVLILLVACLDVPTVVCRGGGVLRRGALDFDGLRFCVGPLVIYPEQVGAVTLERDLLTLHLGAIA